MYFTEGFASDNSRVSLMSFQKLEVITLADGNTDCGPLTRIYDNWQLILILSTNISPIVSTLVTYFAGNDKY